MNGDNPVTDSSKKPAFSVRHIDHVELLVPDRYAAAAWYENVFGLQIVRAYEFWANADGTGPLIVSSDGGTTKLAIFQGNPPGDRDYVGFLRVAFNVDGAGFLAFLDRLDSLELSNRNGERVTPAHAVDHSGSWSIYFTDPWGNRFEITTYAYDSVAAQLRG